MKIAQLCTTTQLLGKAPVLANFFLNSPWLIN
jgi:hypothetical protein